MGQSTGFAAGSWKVRHAASLILEQGSVICNFYGGLSGVCSGLVLHKLVLRSVYKNDF
jgi:hypothetical protein